MKIKEIMNWIWEEVGIIALAVEQSKLGMESFPVEILYSDGKGIYFIVGKEEPLFSLLEQTSTISILAFLPGSSVSKTEYVKLTGKAELLPISRGNAMFSENPDLKETLERKNQLETMVIVKVSQGRGVYYDGKGKGKEFTLEGTPKTTESPVDYSFVKYEITRSCIRCMECVKACPLKAISAEGSRCKINQELCTSCGVCYNTCKFGAINRA